MTMTLDEIVARCKASVHLDINGHRTAYQTVMEGLESDIRQEDISPNEVQQLVDASVVYRLQFYPDTPVGFYIVYGTSLAEVCEKATAILNG